MMSVRSNTESMCSPAPSQPSLGKGIQLTPPSLESVCSSTQTCEDLPCSLEGFGQVCETHRMQVQGVVERMRKVGERRTWGGVTPALPKKPLICPVCMQPFDIRTRVPVALPCGHSVCRICSHSIHRARVLICPEDSTSFFITGTLPINFLLMEMIEQSVAESEFLCIEHSAVVVGFCRQENVFLCGFCAFQHRGHDCCELRSKGFQEVVDERRKLLGRRYEEARGRTEEWIKTVALFNVYCLQLSCSSYAAMINSKDMMSVSGDMKVFYDPEELVFKRVCGELNEIRMLHYSLLETAKEKMEWMERLLTEFEGFSDAEKLLVDIWEEDETADFENFLHSFGMVTSQLGCYSVMQSMSL